jgi:nitronate monooxygenase
VTRAFSGRPARALRNRFIDDFDAAAPAEYPTVHHLTSPIRKSAIAAGDPSAVNLWAGAAHRGVRGGSATEIIAGLWADTAAASRRSVR